MPDRVTGSLPETDTRPTWRDVAVAHRVQGLLLASYVAYAMWGAAYAVRTASQLVTTAVLLTTLANLLTVLAGLALNTAADVRHDQGDSDKSRLVRAARRIGVERIYWWSATEAALALVTALMAAVDSGHWWIALVATVCVAAHAAYNLEPVRLKRRGWAGPILFGAAMTTLPGLVSYLAVRTTVDLSITPILVGVGLADAGRTVLFSVPDYRADQRAGQRTVAVRSGVTRTITLSCVLVATGLLLFGWGLWWRFGPGWALGGAATQAMYLIGIPHLGHGSEGLARMRRRATPLILFADAMLVIIPLIAR